MTSLPIALSGALSAALLHFVWQGAAVALLLWVALGLLRNAPPSVRYAVCCSALGLLAVMPVITVWLLYDPPPAVSVRAVFISPVAGLHRFAAVAPVQWTDLARHWILPIWGLGVVLFSLRMMWFCGQAAWMRRRGDQASDWLVSTAQEIAMRMGVAQKFRLLVSAKADGPSVIGWLRPVIVVPAATITGLTPDQLEAVLAHELAHILRADYLVNLLQSLIETLLFYHPAVWWISGRIRCERELCCDDLAVCACGDALTYARALSILEKLRMSVPEMVMASTGGPLGYRIRRIVGVEMQAARFSKAPGIVALTIMLAFGAAGLNRARGQAQPTPLVKTPAVPATTAPAPQASGIPAVAPKKGLPDQPVVDTRGEQQTEKAAAGDVQLPQSADRENAELAALWQQLDALSRIYGPDHPDIVRIKEGIDELLAQIKKNQPPGDTPWAGLTRDQALDLQRLRVSHEIPRTGALEERIRNQANAYEEGLAEYTAQLAKETDPAQVGRLSGDMAALRMQITYLENELKLIEKFSASNPEVEKITISGLSSETEAQFRAQLPIHVGSRLSSLRFRDYFAVTNGIDKGLEFAIVLLPDAKAEVRITATTK